MYDAVDKHMGTGDSAECALGVVGFLVRFCIALRVYVRLFVFQLLCCRCRVIVVDVRPTGYVLGIILVVVRHYSAERCAERWSKTGIILA